MELFGALYRLVEWFRAKIYLVCEDLAENDVIGDWIEMLEATVVTPTCELSASVWSGSVVISGIKVNVVLSEVLKSCFELLAVVEVHQNILCL